MDLNWLILAPAAILLWIPGWLPQRLHSRQNRGMRSVTPNLAKVVENWWNWADLIRAGGAAYLVIHHGYTLDPKSSSPYADLLLFGVLFGVGTVLQSIRPSRARVAAVWPVFYFCGITLFLPGFQVGVIAVVISWLFTGVLRDPRAQIPIMLVFLGITSFLLNGIDLKAALNGVLLMIPLALTFLLRSPVIILSRQHPHTRRESKSNEMAQTSSDGTG